MKMKKTLSMLLASLLLVGALSSCGGADTPKTPAADNGTAVTTTPQSSGDQLVLRLATQNPDTNITTRTMRRFADLVAEKSGGAIQVDIYPNAQLGAEDVVLQQILTGSLDMAPMSASVLGNVVPEAGIFSIPFLFRDMDTIQSVCWDEEFRTALFGAIREQTGGAEPLGFSTSTARGVSNTKHPVHTVEDLKGLKIRTIGSPISIAAFNAMGATATTVPYKEVYTALQQGLIDGEDGSVDGNITMKFIEVVRYYTELGYMYQNGILLVSPVTWQKLTDDQKAILTECAVEADKFGFEESKNFAPNAYAKAEAEYPDYEIVKELTDEEFATFKNATVPLWDEYKPQIGEEFFDLTVKLCDQYSG